MKHFLILASLLGLAGCVSPESQQQLLYLQQQCAYGDQASCEGAYYQAQANQQEYQNNAGLAAAVLLGGALIAADCCYGPNGGYRQGYHGYGWTSRQGGSGGRYLGTRGGFAFRSTGGGYHGGSHR